MFKPVVSIPPGDRRIGRCGVIRRSIAVAAEGVEAGLWQVVFPLDDATKLGRALCRLLRLPGMTESLSEARECKTGLLVHCREIELLLWLRNPGLHPASARAVVVDTVGGVMRGLRVPCERQLLPVSPQERLIAADLEVVVDGHLQ